MEISQKIIDEEPKDFKEAIENLVQATAFEKNINQTLTIEGVVLSDDEKQMCIDLKPCKNFL